MNNAEIIFINWLAEKIDWQVSGDMLERTPEKFIIVDRTGGTRENCIMDSAELLVEVYHKTSRVECSEMSQHIADIIPEILELEPVAHAKINSIIKLDDLNKQFFRYQIYINLKIRR